MTAYDEEFLQGQGYFTRSDSDIARVNGTEVAFTFDSDTRLAYFEAVDPDRKQAIVSELRSRGRPFDFYWFWNPGQERVAVFNRYGDHKWFVYDQSTEQTADARHSKERQLDSIDDGLEILFDIQAVVDQFYRNLWDIRLDIARSFVVPSGSDITDSERLMAAQRTIDRLIFCYFLVEKDIIHGIDEAGNRFGVSPEQMFERVLETGNLYSFLTEVFFNHVTSEGWTEHEVTDGVSITFPYLNDGLFRDHRIRTTGKTILTESDLAGASYDWSHLVDELSRYNWLVAETPSAEPERGEANKLSPAVLGHIFEKFVITVSEISDDESLSLDELEEVDISASGEQMLAGNRQVGAYYTPNYIAYENTRETLWNKVRQELEALHGIDTSEYTSPDAFFEQVHDDGESLPVDCSALEDIVTDFTVLDPAAGSGAFLMTAGEILENWRTHCCANGSRYQTRRDIVQQSLYGVDLLDGAVEICKLRLWLWLLSATTIDLSEGAPSIEPLPNIDANIRQGNSLVGIAEPGSESLIANADVAWTNGERETCSDAIAAFRENIHAYRVASGTAASELRDRIRKQRSILQEKCTELYAQESSVTVEEQIDSYAEFTRVMGDITGRVKLNLDFDSAMTDTERKQVADAGFREQQNWKTTACHPDIRNASPAQVESVFETITNRGTISIERPIAPADIAALDPCHWIFEFPVAYAPTGDSANAFDIVLGNPPHGSSLSSLQKSLLTEQYNMTDGRREVAKVFVERSWTLTDTELSYIVPKASTYNSNWEEFRRYCLPKMYRGIDLGTAFRTVDHEQVTIHLSQTATGATYTCGRLSDGSCHLDDTAEVAESFATQLGTIPVSFTSQQQAVAQGLGDADFPTLAECSLDAGRGASTTTRVSDPDAPIGYNGKQVQRYFTRTATDHTDVDSLSDTTTERLAAEKVMAQNIIAHVQNPYDHLLIAAAYDPVGSCNFETVTNVLLPDDAPLTLPALTVLLNTQFVNWFVYVSIFNRAIRDMHLDQYFLDRIILPETVTETQQEVLDQLYGLLAITSVATEFDELPKAETTYRELQSLANALVYEMYLTHVDTPPLTTNLSETVSETLTRHEIRYEEWYATHLTCTDAEEVKSLFAGNRELFEEAESVADSIAREDVCAELNTIADHPWVVVMERGKHRGGANKLPLFGPTETRSDETSRQNC